MTINDRTTDRMPNFLSPETLTKYSLPHTDAEVLSKALGAINNGSVSILGFSGKKGAGKDTFAEGFRKLLESEGRQVETIAFASALKGEATSIIEQIRFWLKIENISLTKNEFLAKLAQTNNFHVHQAEHIYNLVAEDLSNDERLDGWSRTRSALALVQYLGTEVRQPQDKLYWVRRTIQDVTVNAVMGITTIISDVRFLHEVESIQDIGAYVVRVNVSPEVQSARLTKRDNIVLTAAALNHRSETELDTYEKFDDIVDNNSGDVNEKIRAAYARYSQLKQAI
jgi:dephospho-CoA kinase